MRKSQVTVIYNSDGRFDKELQGMKQRMLSLAATSSSTFTLSYTLNDSKVRHNDSSSTKRWPKTEPNVVKRNLKELSQ